MFKSFSCADTRRISGKNGRVPGTASIVGVLVLARSDWFVHAVTNGDRCQVGAGLGGCSGEEPFGRVVGVPRYRGVGVGAVEPWG